MRGSSSSAGASPDGPHLPPLFGDSEDTVFAPLRSVLRLFEKLLAGEYLCVCLFASGLLNLKSSFLQTVSLESPTSLYSRPPERLLLLLHLCYVTYDVILLYKL